MHTTATAVALGLLACSTAAAAASYRCPKPDGSFWPGWHDQCPAPNVDPNEPPPPPPPPKRCDFGSTGGLAEVRCKGAVERLAKHTFRWVDGTFEAKFPTQLCAAPGSPQILLKGDRIEFQNGFGAWTRHVYACVWDPQTSTVVSVEAAPW